MTIHVVTARLLTYLNVAGEILSTSPSTPGLTIWTVVGRSVESTPRRVVLQNR